METLTSSSSNGTGDDDLSSAAARIRAAAEHPVVNPVVAEVLKLVADMIGGEWPTADTAAKAVLSCRRVVALESERSESRDRLAALEEKFAATEAQLESVLSTDQHAQVLRELAETRALNARLMSSMAEGYGSLVEARAGSLAQDVAELHAKNKALEAQLAEAQKEIARLQSGGGGKAGASGPAGAGGGGEGSGSGVGADGTSSSHSGAGLRARKPNPDRDAGMEESASP
jgi:hypothetical protein